MLLGLAGYYRLFTRHLAFSTDVALLSTVVLLFNRWTLAQFMTYSGGPLLLFAGLPYFLMSTMFCITRRGPYLVLLPIIFLLGAFLKLAYSLVALGVLGAALLLRIAGPDRCTLKQLFTRTAVDLSAFAIFYLILHVAYTSKGWAATNVGLGKSLTELLVLPLYSLAGLLSGTISLFAFLTRFGCPFFFLNQDVFHQVLAPRWIAVLLLLASLAVTVCTAVVRQTPYPQYRALLVMLAAVHVTLITGLFLGGRLIPEDRHFWPVNAVLLPGVISLIAKISNRIWRWISTGVILLLLAQGIWATYRVQFRIARAAGRSAALRVSFPNRTQELVDLIVRLDDDFPPGRNVFLSTDIALDLLVRKNTILGPLAPGFPFDWSYAGQVDRLVVTVHQQIVSDKSLRKVLANFPMRRDWVKADMGEMIVLYSGPHLPPDLAGRFTELIRRG